MIEINEFKDEYLLLIITNMLFEFLPPETLLYFIVLCTFDIYVFIPIEFYGFNMWQNTFRAVVGQQDSPTI